MSTKTREQIYDAVNSAESLEELAQVIEGLADSTGQIRGRYDLHSCSMMAENCRRYNYAVHNSLTREFGIRQQAMMLHYYNNK